MEELASLWGYQEGIDELKQKLLYTSLELDSLRLQSMEEARKNEEIVKQLVQLIKIACQERDEAKDQLQKLLNKVIPICQKPENTLIKPTKANSSITESNSQSETTYNYNSYNSYSSSPVDSFFDRPVSSPELSNNFVNHYSGTVSTPMVSQKMPMIDQGSMGNHYSGTVSAPMVSQKIPMIDQGSMVIDSIVKGKSLPQNGKFLKSVLEAGPLLHTLLMAGPLPRWRNPPPYKAVQIPPVLINGCDAEIVARKSMNLPSFGVLNLGNGPFGPCVSNRQLLPTSCSNASSYVPTGKRQRFH